MGFRKIIFIVVCLVYFTSKPAQCQVIFNSSNLPIIVINTNGQTIDPVTYIVCDMGIIYNGPGAINYITDPFNDYDGKISIRKRGTTSLTFPKNSFRIETQDDEGNNLNVSLMDMPAENDWVLYGPYPDKSLMRNVLLYELARRMGWYGPRTKFCELTINDEYLGVYVLIEKIKRDKNRVDIAKLSPSDTSGSDVTGGYLLEVDRWEGPGWHSAFNSKIFFEYKYPKHYDIIPEQETYIQEFIYQFEERLFNLTEFTDTTLQNTADFNSFIDYIILSEFSKNADAYRASTFLHKNNDAIDGRLKMGPVWDYNLAFGNYADFFAYQTSGFIYSDSTFWVYAPFWFRKLMTFEHFQNQTRCRWEQLRCDVLHKNHLFAIVDSCWVLLNEAQERNFQKWEILGVPVWPNYYVGETYEEEISILKDWITGRLAWLDDSFPGDCDTTYNCDTTYIGDHVFEDIFDFRIYPNPVSSCFTAEYRLGEPASLQVNMYDQLNRRVFNKEERNQLPGIHKMTIQTSGMKDGLYYVVVIINNRKVGVRSVVIMNNRSD